MKRLLFFFWILASAVACTNQQNKAIGETNQTRNDSASASGTESNNHPELNDRIQTYLLLYQQLKFDTLMNYVYPTFFQLAPREQLSGFFKSFFATPGLDVHLDTMKLLSVDPVSRFSKGEVTKFDYRMLLRIKFDPKQNNMAVTAENRNRIVNTLKRTLGTNDVSYNEATGYFRARAEKSALAIKDSATGHEWKFISLEQNDQLKAILPDEVARKYFPETKQNGTAK